MKGVDGNKEIIYLTRDEISRLESWEFAATQQSLARVRDVFLFCCFTGLRYSDVAKLKRTDIKDGFFDVVTQRRMTGYASNSTTMRKPSLTNTGMTTSKAIWRCL